VEKVGESMISQMDKLLALVKQYQPISIYELFKKTDYQSYSSVHHRIQLLEAKGMVEIKPKLADDKLKKVVSIK
jgi:predicted transcriptional regulator